MSKIYEALQHAEKIRLEEDISIQERAGQEEKRPDKQSCIPVVEEITFENAELKMEDEMISLYQSINSLLPKPEKKVIQFIGSRKDEGTSTIVRELAMVTANNFGKSVLLLDADIYKPVQHHFFNIVPEYSFIETFRDDKSAKNGLYKIAESSLFMSQFSKNYNYASNFFNMSGNQDIWKNLKQQFDFIFIDSAPASICLTGLPVFKNVDGIVLVVEAENTRWQVVENIKENILKNGGNVIGTVLNKRKYHIPDFIYKKLLNTE